jgi:hypothetical protein
MKSEAVPATLPRVTASFSLGHLASTGERHRVSLWRWQPRRQTWDQESGGAEGSHQPASPLVFWPALCAVDGSMGWLSPAGGLSRQRPFNRCPMPNEDFIKDQGLTLSQTKSSPAPREHLGRLLLLQQTLVGGAEIS